MTTILISFAYVCLLLWASLVAYIAHSVLFVDLEPLSLTHAVVLGAAIILVVDASEDRRGLSISRYFAEQFSGLTFALVVVLMTAPYVLGYVK